MGQRQRSPCRDPHSSLRSISPLHRPKFTWENYPGKQRAGSWHCCMLSEMATVCVHPLKHICVYICIEIACHIKHRCHFSLRSQLAERKGLAYQPVGEFSPALSLSRGKESALSALCACVHASEPGGPGRARLEGQSVGDEDSGPTRFRGVCCGLLSPKPLGSWSTLGACWEHGIPCPGMGELLGTLQGSCRQAV